MKYFKLISIKKTQEFRFLDIGRTHGAPDRGYGYVPLRFAGGDVVWRMGTQQQRFFRLR